MQNARSGAGARDLKAGGQDHGDHTVSPYRLQDTLDRAMRHEWSAPALGSILAIRLDQKRCLVLTAGGLHSLDPDLRDRLLEAAHLDFHGDDEIEIEAERQRRQWCQHCATTWRRARR